MEYRQMLSEERDWKKKKKTQLKNSQLARVILSFHVSNILILKFLEINIVSMRVQINYLIICFRATSDYAEICRCALGYWDSLIEEGTRCSIQIDCIFHQWKIITFPSSIVFQVELISANCRYLEARCL